MGKSRKIRPLGQITEEIEPLLQEMVEAHEMQIHEIIGMITLYLQSHCPDAIEQYEDGKVPTIYYTHPDVLIKND